MNIWCRRRQIEGIVIYVSEPQVYLKVFVFRERHLV